MAPPSAAASFAEDTQRLRQREIILLGDLEGALAAAHHHHRQSDLLAERRVVGRDAIGLARLAVGALDDLSRKCLWGLCSPKAKAVDGDDDLSARIDAFQGVRYGQR